MTMEKELFEDAKLKPLRITSSLSNEKFAWTYDPVNHLLYIPYYLLRTLETETLIKWRKERPIGHPARFRADPDRWKREDYFIFFHELGHIHLRNENIFISYEDYFKNQYENKLREEYEAWQYAARCLKPFLHDEMWKFAWEAIKTYLNDGRF